MAQPLPKIYKRFPKELFRINAGALVNVRPKATPGPVPIVSKYDIITTGLTPDDGEAKAPAFTSMWIEALRQDKKETPAPRVNQRALLHEHVEPRAVKGRAFAGPNGLRLRLNTPFTQHYILRQWKGENPVVFAVQAGKVAQHLPVDPTSPNIPFTLGTPLPSDLVLVRLHPQNEEWSLEPARRMTLQGETSPPPRSIPSFSCTDPKTELNDAINKFLAKNAAKLTRQQWGTAYPRATEPRKAVPVPSKWKVPSHNWLAGRVRRGPLFYPHRKT